MCSENKETPPDSFHVFLCVVCLCICMCAHVCEGVCVCNT